MNSDRKFGGVAELHEKRFVVGVHGLQELSDGCLRSPKLIVHAAALVEDQANRERRILAGKVRHGLFHAVFQKMEIFFLKPQNEAIQRISNRYRESRTRRGVYSQVVTCGWLAVLSWKGWLKGKQHA